MRIDIKVLDYFFVLRPTLFFPVWTTFLAGRISQVRIETSSITDRQLGVLDHQNGLILTLAGLFLTLLMGGIFILNQIKDVVTDSKNNKLFLIANNYINKENARTEAFFLIVFSIILAFHLSIELGFLFIVLFTVTGVVYNLSPFTWKDKPFLGLMANALGGFLIFSIGWYIDGKIGIKFAIHSLPYVFAIAAVYFYTTLPDIEGDELAEKITFGVKFGFKLTTYWALFFEIMAIISSLLLKDYVILVPALLSFPFFLWATVSQELNDVLKAVKFSILFLSIMICLYYPLYFLLVLFIFFFSKWYYKKRFNLQYPRFSA